MLFLTWVLRSRPELFKDRTEPTTVTPLPEVQPPSLLFGDGLRGKAAGSPSLLAPLPFPNLPAPKSAGVPPSLPCCWWCFCLMRPGGACWSRGRKVPPLARLQLHLYLPTFHAALHDKKARAEKRAQLRTPLFSMSNFEG